MTVDAALREAAELLACNFLPGEPPPPRAAPVASASAPSVTADAGRASRPGLCAGRSDPDLFEAGRAAEFATTESRRRTIQTVFSDRGSRRTADAGALARPGARDPTRGDSAGCGPGLPAGSDAETAVPRGASGAVDGAVAAKGPASGRPATFLGVPPSPGRRAVGDASAARTAPPPPGPRPPVVAGARAARSPRSGARAAARAWELLAPVRGDAPAHGSAAHPSRLSDALQVSRAAAPPLDAAPARAPAEPRRERTGAPASRDAAGARVIPLASADADKTQISLPSADARREGAAAASPEARPSSPPEAPGRAGATPARSAAQGRPSGLVLARIPVTIASATPLHGVDSSSSPRAFGRGADRPPPPRTSASGAGSPPPLNTPISSAHPSSPLQAPISDAHHPSALVAPARDPDALKPASKADGTPPRRPAAHRGAVLTQAAPGPDGLLLLEDVEAQFRLRRADRPDGADPALPGSRDAPRPSRGAFEPCPGEANGVGPAAGRCADLAREPIRADPAGCAAAASQGPVPRPGVVPGFPVADRRSAATPALGPGAKHGKGFGRDRPKARAADPDAGSLEVRAERDASRLREYCDEPTRSGGRELAEFSSPSPPRPGDHGLAPAGSSGSFREPRSGVPSASPLLVPLPEDAHPVLRLGWRPLCVVVCNGLYGEFYGGHDRDLYIRATSREYVHLPPRDAARGGSVMSCSQFERAAGRELSKKWKESIHVVGEGEGSRATLLSWLRRKAEAEHGLRAVGSRVWVAWPADRAWYRGTVVAYLKESGKHRVAYDEGTSEDLHLPVELLCWEDRPPSLDEAGAAAGADGAAPRPLPPARTSPPTDRSAPAASSGDGFLREARAALEASSASLRRVASATALVAAASSPRSRKRPLASGSDGSGRFALFAEARGATDAAGDRRAARASAVPFDSPAPFKTPLLLAGRGAGGTEGEGAFGARYGGAEDDAASSPRARLVTAASAPLDGGHRAANLGGHVLLDGAPAPRAPACRDELVESRVSFPSQASDGRGQADSPASRHERPPRGAFPRLASSPVASPVSISDQLGYSPRGPPSGCMDDRASRPTLRASYRSHPPAHRRPSPFDADDPPATPPRGPDDDLVLVQRVASSHPGGVRSGSGVRPADAGRAPRSPPAGAGVSARTGALERWGYAEAELDAPSPLALRASGDSAQQGEVGGDESPLRAALESGGSWNAGRRDQADRGLREGGEREALASPRAGAAWFAHGRGSRAWVAAELDEGPIEPNEARAVEGAGRIDGFASRPDARGFEGAASGALDAATARRLDRSFAHRRPALKRRRVLDVATEAGCDSLWPPTQHHGGVLAPWDESDAEFLQALSLHLESKAARQGRHGDARVCAAFAAAVALAEAVPGRVRALARACRARVTDALTAALAEGGGSRATQPAVCQGPLAPSFGIAAPGPPVVPAHVVEPAALVSSPRNSKPFPPPSSLRAADRDRPASPPHAPLSASSGCMTVRESPMRSAKPAVPEPASRFPGDLGPFAGISVEAVPCALSAEASEVAKRERRTPFDACARDASPESDKKGSESSRFVPSTPLGNAPGVVVASEGAAPGPRKAPGDATGRETSSAAAGDSGTRGDATEALVLSFFEAAVAQLASSTPSRPGETASPVSIGA